MRRHVIFGVVCLQAIDKYEAANQRLETADGAAKRAEARLSEAITRRAPAQVFHPRAPTVHGSGWCIVGCTSRNFARMFFFLIFLSTVAAYAKVKTCKCDRERK